MRYDALSNDLFVRRRVTPPHVWTNGIFEPFEIDAIIEYCEREELVDGKVIGGDEYGKDIRESKVKFFRPNTDIQWVFERFNGILKEINDAHYGFDLDGYDSFQYTVYAENGKFEWHTDLLYGLNLGNTENNSTRKLTCVMLLNEPDVDFTGGEFQVNTVRECEAETINFHRGMILVFPSFVPHRVLPILTGVRKSLVIWVEGPKFR